MKILLVDGDALLRDMYATKFTEHGHTVQVAESGERALEPAKEETYDVVLLDLLMPGMHGLEVLKALHDKAKCVVLSNQGEEPEIEEAKAAGAAGYIIKASMIPSEVVAKVESLAK